MNAVVQRLDRSQKIRPIKFRSIRRLLASKVALSLCGMLSAVLSVTPAWGADRITFSLPVLGDFSISANDLEVFAKEGKITPDFAFYAKRAKPQQLAQLRSVLQTRLEATPTTIAQFTYEPLGEMFVRRLGDIFQTETRDNGFYAVRSTLILSAADPEGLTILSLLRHFPSRNVRLNINRALAITSELSNLLKKRSEIVAEIQQESTAAAAQSSINFSQKPDLRIAGSFQWRKESLLLSDRSRKLPEGGERKLPIDFYVPQAKQNSSPFPVVVISHGVAENRQTFAYLAQHLASYGFAVAVLEHPGTSTQKFQQYFAGFGNPPQPSEFVDRALDVKFLLDELQQRTQSDPTLTGRINFQRVGVIGHSLGGYTALALAGATIDFQRLRQVCQNNQSFDISITLQCRATEITQATNGMRDDRVKAVLAVSPLTNAIFGQRGMSQIQVPVMMISSSEDSATPDVPEQILPFTWLKTPNKYLALIEHGTHSSTQADERIAGLPMLPGRASATSETARSYLDALSVAFLKTYLSEQAECRPYLSAAYAKFVSKAPMNLSLVQSLTTQQIVQLLDETEEIAGTSAPSRLEPR